MPVFNHELVQELQRYLNNTAIHDSEIDAILFEHTRNRLVLSMHNEYYKKTIAIVCEKIKIVLFSSANWYKGGYATISGITIEADYNALKKYTEVPKNYKDNTIYLVIQLANGKELYIITETVFVEEQQDALEDRLI